MFVLIYYCFYAGVIRDDTLIMGSGGGGGFEGETGIFPRLGLMDLGGLCFSLRLGFL